MSHISYLLSVICYLLSVILHFMSYLYITKGYSEILRIAFYSHTYLWIFFAISPMISGVVRQHPPIILAPASRHAST